jgi:ubiquinone biosynthesis UbiH/UbiF/VisC/COQ6 family hydroxylase
VSRDAFHVAVIGGGVVGCAAALMLDKLGFAVTVFERKVPEISAGALGFDLRNVALSPASVRQLDEIGVWQGLRSVPYERMVVWEEWGVGEISFAADEVGRDELGWLVEMSPLQTALWDRLGECEVATKVGSIDTVEVSADGVRIGSDTGVEHADFVIGADGANSLVRQALDVPVIAQETGQVALATVVRTEQEHEATAWQRFLHQGPLALLPTPDMNVCSVVWSQPPESAQARQELDDASFCREISVATEHRLGAVVECDRRVVFPLTQQRVKSCAPHARALLVGDAMRVIHPLAGQGVNLGLEDVRGLVSVARRLDDLTANGVWRRFARQRQIRSDLMIKTMASLQGIYGSHSPMLGWVRNVGVRAVDRQGWLKHQIMREALGLGPIARAANV